VAPLPRSRTLPAVGMSSTDRRRNGVFLALLVAGAALYLLPLRVYGLMVLDEGYVVHAARRMLAGEVLYRDVYAHYAPFRYHLLEAAFALTRPSLLVARTVFVAVILANVMLAHRLALRLAPPGLAWVPAALGAPAPGPWTTCVFGLSVGLGALAAVRVLERPTPGRLVALGAAAAGALLIRQDIGCLQVGLAGVVAAVAAHPRIRVGSGRSPGPGAWRAMALAAGGAAVVLVPVLAWYASRGALGPMVHATLGRAFTQREAYGFAGAAGASLWQARGLGGAILVAPAAILAAAAVAWLTALVRRGLAPTLAAVAVLLVLGVGALPNAYYQLRLLRVLQSSLPYLLLATWLTAEAAGIARRRFPRGLGELAAGLVEGAFVSASAVAVWGVIVGIPVFAPGAEYSGSLRMARYRTPIEVMGDRLQVDWNTAERLRLLRDFVDAHVPKDEPILALPFAPLDYETLERPNALWMVIDDWMPGDYLLTDAEKKQQSRKLLASPVRYAFADVTWVLRPGPRDALANTLLEAFHPIRRLGPTLVLERGHDADAATEIELARRLTRGGVGEDDVLLARAIAIHHPADAYPRELLALAEFEGNDPDAAIVALEAAARLEPGNPELLEQAAEVALARGRATEAARLTAEALAVHPGPRARAIWIRLPRSLRPPAPPLAPQPLPRP
jgi:hypothetical protein